MREVAIDTTLVSKLAQGKKTFYERELPENFPSLTPGEWIKLVSKEQSWTAFGNRFAQDVPSIWIIETQESEPLLIIKDKLNSALAKRLKIYRNEGKRLVYGQSDDLPGLIIDEYEHHILIQINTAGLDKYRNEIKSFIKEKFPTKKAILFDRKSYRSAESLPAFESEWNDDEVIEARDSGLVYRLSMDKMQKIGFYYDHRDNRNKFERYVKSYYQNTEWNALDLYCYLGAWGLHAARAGAQSVDFVDQADLEKAVFENSLQLGSELKITFNRSDVFKYLDSAIAKQMKWKAIVCDPPAFCKSKKQKSQALSGYQKLYTKIFKLLDSDSTLVAASCTKYVEFEELLKIVESQASAQGRKIHLRDIGVQGMDHPFSGLNDNACYIKFALYAVE